MKKFMLIVFCSLITITSANAHNPLVTAVERGNLVDVEAALAAGALIDDAKTPDKLIPVLALATKNDTADTPFNAILVTLLKHKASPFSFDYMGNTPLMHAINNDNIKAVELLLAAIKAHGESAANDINWTNEDFETAFDLAALKPEIQALIVRMLPQAKSAASRMICGCIDALKVTASEAVFTELQRYLRDIVLPECPTFMERLLIEACIQDHEALVSQLLIAGAPSGDRSTCGISALALATSLQRANSVKALLAHSPTNARINERIDTTVFNSKLALLRTIDKPAGAIIDKMLAQRGIDATKIKSVDGLTIYEIALTTKNAAIIKLLRDHGGKTSRELRRM